MPRAPSRDGGMVDQVRRCPHCGAHCTPQTVVCPACGVDIAAFGQAMEQLRDANDLRHQKQIHALQRASAQQGAKQAQVERGHWQRQLLGLLLGALIVAALIVVAVQGCAAHRRILDERVEEEYAAALACLQAGDYRCAKEGFHAVLRQDQTRSEARENLHIALLALAQQYALAGQWEEGLEELDELLSDDPANTQALALAKDIYRRWYDETIAKGQWLKAQRIRSMWLARFPEDASEEFAPPQDPASSFSL